MDSNLTWNGCISCYTDQPKKEALFSRFTAEHPCTKIFFVEKNKHHLFRRGFSPQKFAEKLCEISQRNSGKFRHGVGKDLRFFHAEGSE